MNTFRKVTIALGLAVACGSMAQAQSSADASFLLTSESGGIALDVLVENPAVTVFDLTIPVGSMSKASASLDGCTSGIGGSHVGGCNIAEGEFRMVVFSALNAPLESGRIGSFALPETKFSMDDILIRAYNEKGEEMKVEVLADLPNLSAGDARDAYAKPIREVQQ